MLINELNILSTEWRRRLDAEHTIGLEMRWMRHQSARRINTKICAKDSI